jgi:hypothetical protein
VEANASGQALGSGCWVSGADACSFQIDNSPQSVVEITADIALRNCQNTWAAPLWIDPVPYAQAGKYSGEIDVMEICGNGVDQNFAGFGFQTVWGAGQGKALLTSGFDKMRFHVKYHQPDPQDPDAGSVTTWACGLDGDKETSSCIGGGKMENFYDTYRKSSGDNVRFHLVTDTWNAVPNIAKGQGANCGNTATAASTCGYTVENIKLTRQDGQPVFASGVCASLNAQQ